jgi:hypothetical protein
VYAAFGADANSNFTLSPAVRDPKGSCIEEGNCNFERATLCAFDAADSMASSVSFLECMDDTSATTALADAAKCAKAATPTPIDDAKITACYNGAAGDALLVTASAAWNKAYPSRATVPCIQVNGVKVAEASFAPIKTAMCKAGSTASVC